MKAVTFTKYGPPEVLTFIEIDKPSPQEGEVLIKIRATTTTAGDWRMRKADPLLARLMNGLFRPKRVNVLGFEVAGDIEAVGEGVTEFKPGDAVFAGTGFGFGGYAEYITLPTSAVTPKPTNLSYEEAAAVPVGARTALRFLRSGGIGAGQRVMIYGASGSVGTYAVQIAKHFGAHVTGVCSAPNMEMVSELGADIVLDYTTRDFHISNEKYDIVFDTVGKSNFSDALNALTPEGSYLLAYLPPTKFIRANLSKANVITEPTTHRDDLTYLKDLLEAGSLRVVIDRCYPLTDIVKAHHYVQAGHKKGNVPILVEGVFA